MNKEMEALNGIKKAFASHLVRETSMTFEQALESLNYDTDLQNIEKAIKELEEIKKRAEERKVFIQEMKQKYGPYDWAMASDELFGLIDYILKGEKV